jgi:hypothetical protein
MPLAAFRLSAELYHTETVPVGDATACEKSGIIPVSNGMMLPSPVNQ